MGDKPATDKRRRSRSRTETVIAHAAKPAAADLPAADLLRELQAHQVELEMQNEALRRAQLALEVAQASYVDLYDFAPIGYLTVDEAGTITRTNLTGASLLGVERPNLVGRPFAGFVEGSEVDRWHLLLTSLLRGGRQLDFDMALRWDDGSVFDAHLACQRRADDGSVPLVRVVLTDITKRKRAEEALLASEAKFRTYVRRAPVGIFVVDGQGRYLDSNPAGLEMLGVDAATARSMAIADVLDEAAREAAPRDLASLASTERVKEDMRLVRPDGRILWITLSATSIAEDRYLAFCQDITERKRAQEALRESEERYRSVVTNMTEGVVVRDMKGVVTACNPAAERIFGLRASEAGSTTSHDPRWRAIHEDGSQFVADDYPASVALRFGRPQLNVVMGFQKPDGALTWVKTNSEPLRDPQGRVSGVVTTVADVTERRALRERFAASSRLAALGTLVAGVAHEINNPLAGEMSSQAMAIQEARKMAEMLLQGEPLDRDDLARRAGEVVELLDDSQLGSRRIANIVRELSAFGRSSPNCSPIQLSSVVESAMTWLPPSVGRDVVIRIESEEAPDVLASTGQLEQVVMNLVSNAALAIPKGQYGEITIRTGAGSHGMSWFEVSDNGTGIPPDDLTRIFDPFFTTRDVGKGMGLGLFVCHAIVTAHGGTLTATSVPGSGSTFRVELPACLTPLPAAGAG
jgi:PAS domain S-box-containing protein